MIKQWEETTKNHCPTKPSLLTVSPTMAPLAEKSTKEKKRGRESRSDVNNKTYTHRRPLTSTDGRFERVECSSDWRPFMQKPQTVKAYERHNKNNTVGIVLMSSVLTQILLPREWNAYFA